MKRIIYDFGANTGDDIPYYLKKADTVVAVEANPILCDAIKSKFHHEVDAGQLIVENCVLTDQIETDVSLYINRRVSDHSQFNPPADNKKQDFDPITVPSLLPTTIISRHGEPFYLKVDVEGYDKAILRTLFANNIFPTFISAESHSIDIFASLVACGHYNAFKLIEGASVSKKYRQFTFISKDGDTEFYSFPYNSAGPFGEDIHGEWMTADNFFLQLATEGLGWKDIHATHLDETKMNKTRWKKIRIRHYLFKRLNFKLRRMFKFTKPR